MAEENFKHTTYVIANWKMNPLVKDSLKLTKEIKKSLPKQECPHIVLCPPYTSLAAVHDELKGVDIMLGAQDVFWEETGNFTGEVSIDMLKEIGVSHIIIGHSERRQHLGETDEMIDRKVAAMARHHVVPIVCVGETAEQRRQGVQQMVIVDQVKKAFRYMPPPHRSQRILVCYEPVWSIYPGQPCEPDQAKEMANVIYQTLIDLYPADVVNNNFIMLYGGSVTGDNVAEYVDKENIFGVLVGTASRDPKTFANIINNIPC